MESSQLFEKINNGILEERYLSFTNNLNKNLNLIKNFGGLKDIVPQFSGKNIIIIGAGPSLNGHIDYLKKYQYRKEIILLSTDMALLPLIKRDIIPSYVISCETTPVDYFSSIDTEKIHLFAFSCISNANLRKWKGNISFYNWMIHNEYYDRLWEKAGHDLGFLATGSIVTTQAISFALGCNIASLMIIGNDLGFDKEYYARNTLSYYRNLNMNNRFSTIDSIEFNTCLKRREYKINRGERAFYTSNQFLAAKMWLEDLFIQMDAPIFECNDRGCSEKKVEKISLKNYMERFDKRTRKPKWK